MRTMLIQLIIFLVFSVLAYALVYILRLLTRESGFTAKRKSHNTYNQIKADTNSLSLGQAKELLEIPESFLRAYPRRKQTIVGAALTVFMMLLSFVNYDSVISTYDIFTSGKDAIAKVIEVHKYPKADRRGTKIKTTVKLSFDGNKIWTGLNNFEKMPSYGQEFGISYLTENPAVFVVGQKTDGFFSLLYYNIGMFRFLVTLVISLVGGFGTLMLINGILIRKGKQIDKMADELPQKYNKI